jgi:hypothetical protein
MHMSVRFGVACGFGRADGVDLTSYLPNLPHYFVCTGNGLKPVVTKLFGATPLYVPLKQASSAQKDFMRLVVDIRTTDQCFDRKKGHRPDQFCNHGFQPMVPNNHQHECHRHEPYYWPQLPEPTPQSTPRSTYRPYQRRLRVLHRLQCAPFRHARRRRRLDCFMDEPHSNRRAILY